MIYELEFLRNKTYNKSFHLSAKTKDIKSINVSIFNALNESSSDLFKLVNLLNMSTILNYGLLKNRINIIENATFGRRFAPVQFTCFNLHLLQVIIGWCLPMALVYMYIVT